MAKNLQSKLKPSDKVAIFDVNTTALEGLSAEMKAASSGAAVEVAASAHDASKEAVSHHQSLFYLFAVVFCAVSCNGRQRLNACTASVGSLTAAMQPLATTTWHISD